MCHGTGHLRDKEASCTSSCEETPEVLLHTQKGAPKDGSGSTASGGDHAEAGLPAIPAGKQHRPGRQQSREPFWGKARQVGVQPQRLLCSPQCILFREASLLAAESPDFLCHRWQCLVLRHGCPVMASAQGPQKACSGAQQAWLPCHGICTGASEGMQWGSTGVAARPQHLHGGLRRHAGRLHSMICARSRSCAGRRPRR